MADNIYKVEKESDLNEILLDKKNGLVVVMFTDHLALDKTILRQMRLNIFELSQSYPDVFFVYIDLQKFSETDVQQHTKDIKIPRFTFYYNCEDSGYVEGMDMDVFAKTLQGVADQIHTITAQKQDDNEYNTNNTPIAPATQNEPMEHNEHNDINKTNYTDTISHHSQPSHEIQTHQLTKIGTSLKSLKDKQHNSLNSDDISTKTRSNTQTPTLSQKPSDEPTESVPRESDSTNNNLSKEDLQDLLQMKQYLTNSGQKVDFDQLLRVYNNMKQQKSKDAVNQNKIQPDGGEIPKSPNQLTER